MSLIRRRYLVSNYIISMVLKPNKWETCLQKITFLLTNERLMLMDNFFCI